MTTTTEPGTGTSPPRAWAAIATIATATFAVVTTELLPVGLLTPIAADLRVAPGTVGLTMTVPALVAAVSAPLLTLVIRSWDRRFVLAGLVGLLVLANAVSTVATVFPVLLVARLAAGLATGGVWAMAAGLAMRLVPPRSVARATCWSPGTSPPTPSCARCWSSSVASGRR
ncbi:MFS transporter [Pseudonocardia spinosispora]|uniref:MFS transporter n=1 Tax=Pseudonocardia spinosispora TaxID=103441 RepID=UPI0004093391|nr:MFS transporter [Pseudonocardia spinosispora]